MSKSSQAQYYKQWWESNLSNPLAKSQAWYQIMSVSWSRVCTHISRYNTASILSWSMQPCSEIVKLIACVVGDETLDARGVLRVRDSKLLCDPQSDISKFHERGFDEAVLKQCVSSSCDQKNGYCIPGTFSGFCHGTQANGSFGTYPGRIGSFRRLWT